MFCAFDILAYFVANNACRTNEKTEKTKQERFCFAKEFPKVMQNDIVVTMMPIMQPFVFHVFAPFLPSRVCMLWPTKHAHAQN